MVATDSPSKVESPEWTGTNKVLERVDNDRLVAPAYLGSIEADIVTVDATVRPTTTVRRAHPLLGLDELLPPAFMAQHTATEDAEEFFAPFGVTRRADLLDLPQTADAVVDETTDFAGLEEMLEAALEFRLG